MAEKIHEMYKPLADLDDIAVKMERSRSCCNLIIEAFEDENKHLPDGGGWLSEILLTLHLASNVYYEAETYIEIPGKGGG